MWTFRGGAVDPHPLWISWNARVAFAAATKPLDALTGRNTVMHPADFKIRADVVCRLNPGMARRLVEVVEYDYQK